MANNNIQIERLKGRENFHTWKFAMEQLLCLDGLWGTIDESDKDAIKMRKAKAKLILMIEPINFAHVQDCKTRKEVWEKLCSTFEDSGLTRKVGLLRKLLSTNLENSTSVEDFVNTITTTAHKLKSVQLEVTDEWVEKFTTIFKFYILTLSENINSM